MELHGYILTGSWNPGQRGQTISAKKGGKKFFIKKYTNFVLPTKDGTYDATTIRKKKEAFDAFSKLRMRIVDTLRRISVGGGNIIVPCEYFVEGNHYYEVTEFVDGAIRDEDLEAVLSTISADSKKMTMLTAAGALSSIHSVGVIHGDLKLPNILVVKNGAGSFVAKIIDFDSSYFVDDRRYIGGDDVYCSPELGDYIATEDEEEQEELAKKLTPKTDIFSLGVVFHFYLTGKLPQPKTLSPGMQRTKERKERAGKKAVFYPWDILKNGCELKLDDSITSLSLRALLLDMMDKDPEKRPTAAEVLDRLKSGEPTIETPWPEHNLMLDRARMTADGIAGLAKRLIGSEKKYEILSIEGRKTVLNRDEIIAKGYAKPIVSGYPEPWPEHDIVFVEEKLAELDFVAGERKTQGGVNGYQMYRSDGWSRFFNVSNLRMTGCIKAPPVMPGEAKPRPEDNIVFNSDVLRGLGFVRIEQATFNGVKGYRCIRSDGSNQFMPVSRVLFLGIAKKL